MTKIIVYKQFTTGAADSLVEAYCFQYDKDNSL